MNLKFKSYIRYLLHKTIGTTSFIRRIEWRRIRQWLQPQKYEDILDVACGSGELSLIIAKSSCNIYGIDMSKVAIESAIRLSSQVGISADFKIGDAEHLQYPDKHFDKVVCSSSLEHFNDDTLALKEISRVLKSGGKFVFTVDCLSYPITKELKDKHKKMCSVVHYYSVEELERNLEISGLVMNRSEYLINSFLTDIFFRIWIKYRPPEIFWLLIACVGYPVFLISDRLFGRKDCGYTLIIEATKVN